VQFKFLKAIFFAFFCAASVVGCGTVGQVQSACADAKGEGAAANVVTACAQQRWNALLKHDLAVAYEFISPGGRSLMSLAQYSPRINSGSWRGAKAEKASCGAETCEVTVMVDVVVSGVKAAIPVKETWILEAGRWWFVFPG
jgi:hypothetical protein